MTTDVVPAGDAALTGMEGLEDVESSDLVMPRITVIQESQLFKDGLTGEEFELLDCVLLGLVKQRVLWPAEVPEGESFPLCKSFDAKIGNPKDGFPWESSKFKKSDFKDENPQLACGACHLKEWETHPKRDKVPWCTEQWVFPLIHQGGPALFTIQRSGMKAAKAYVSSFVRAKTPMFTVRTEITLAGRKRGKVEYSEPMIKKTDDTEDKYWPDFAHQFRQIRDYLVTPRALDDEMKASAEPVAKASDDGGEAEVPF